MMNARGNWGNSGGWKTFDKEFPPEAYERLNTHDHELAKLRKEARNTQRKPNTDVVSDYNDIEEKRGQKVKEMRAAVKRNVFFFTKPHSSKTHFSDTFSTSSTPADDASTPIEVRDFEDTSPHKRPLQFKSLNTGLREEGGTNKANERIERILTENGEIADYSLESRYRQYEVLRNVARGDTNLADILSSDIRIWRENNLRLLKEYKILSTCLNTEKRLAWIHDIATSDIDYLVANHKEITLLVDYLGITYEGMTLRRVLGDDGFNALKFIETRLKTPFFGDPMYVAPEAKIHFDRVNRKANEDFEMLNQETRRFSLMIEPKAVEDHRKVLEKLREQDTFRRAMEYYKEFIAPSDGVSGIFRKITTPVQGVILNNHKKQGAQRYSKVDPVGFTARNISGHTPKIASTEAQETQSIGKRIRSRFSQLTSFFLKKI